MMRVLLSVALLTAVMGLVLINVHLLTWQVDISAVPPPHPTGSPSGSRDAATPQRPASEAVALADLTETTARPLFWPSRRPKLETAAPAAKSAPEPAATTEAVSFRLAGIVHAAGVRKALIVSSERPAGWWVEEGVVIEGWRLSRIEHHAIRIEAGGTHRELKLP